MIYALIYVTGALAALAIIAPIAVSAHDLRNTCCPDKHRYEHLDLKSSYFFMALITLASWIGVAVTLVAILIFYYEGSK